MPGIQGSKISLVRSYLRVTQAAGQVIILIFLVKIKYFPIYVNSFCDAGQVPIFRYFEAWDINLTNLSSLTSVLPSNTSDSGNSSIHCHKIGFAGTSKIV